MVIDDKTIASEWPNVGLITVNVSIFNQSKVFYILEKENVEGKIQHFLFKYLISIDSV